MSLLILQRSRSRDSCFMNRRRRIIALHELPGREKLNDSIVWPIFWRDGLLNWNYPLNSLVVDEQINNTNIRIKKWSLDIGSRWTDLQFHFPAFSFICRLRFRSPKSRFVSNHSKYKLKKLWLEISHNYFSSQSFKILLEGKVILFSGAFWGGISRGFMRVLGQN